MEYRPMLLLTFSLEAITLPHQNFNLIALKLFVTAGSCTRCGGTSAHAISGSESMSEHGVGCQSGSCGSQPGVRNRIGMF